MKNENIALFVLAITATVVITFMLTSIHFDMPAERAKAAEAVCVAANSKLVSFDRAIATCASQAQIPYTSQ